MRTTRRVSMWLAFGILVLGLRGVQGQRNGGGRGNRGSSDTSEEDLLNSVLCAEDGTNAHYEEFLRYSQKSREWIIQKGKGEGSRENGGGGGGGRKGPREGLPVRPECRFFLSLSLSLSFPFSQETVVQLATFFLFGGGGGIFQLALLHQVVAQSISLPIRQNENFRLQQWSVLIL